MEENVGNNVTLRREDKDKNLKAPTLKQNMAKRKKGAPKQKGFTAKGLCKTPKNLTIKLVTNFKNWILMGGGLKGIRRSVF